MCSVYIIYSFVSFDISRLVAVKLAHSKVLFRFESIFTKCIFYLIFPLVNCLSPFWNSRYFVCAWIHKQTRDEREKIALRPCYSCPIWKYDISFVNIKILRIKLKKFRNAMDRDSSDSSDFHYFSAFLFQWTFFNVWKSDKYAELHSFIEQLHKIMLTALSIQS